MASNRMQAEAARLRAKEKFAKSAKREKDASLTDCLCVYFLLFTTLYKIRGQFSTF